jgi:hypothetical protein
MMATTYGVFVWDHEAECWEPRHEGVSKWGLRPIIRELRSEGWSSVSVLISEEPPQ